MPGINAFGNALGSSLAESMKPSQPKLDDDPKRAMARGMALDRKFNSLSASAGDAANPLDFLRDDTAWKNAPLVGQVFPSQSYFDPKIDSFLFNRESGDGVLLRRDENADGSTLDVFANGFKSTDANGNSSSFRRRGDC